MQYLILVILGAAVSAFALQRLRAKRERLRGMLRAEAAVLEVTEEPWPVPGRGGILYRVRARFTLPDGRTVEGLSRNTVHDSGDYPPGSRETVAYRPDVPEEFYILRDREYTGVIFLCFGVFVLLLGVILLLAGRI